MMYNKPEIKTLGEATMVIQNPVIKGGPRFTDFPRPDIINPAYDLDE